MSFRLYPEEQHWSSFADYGAILSVTRRVAPVRALEFGPGWSTLALVEGGARHVDALEDDRHWLKVARERLAPFADVVRVLPYTWFEDRPIVPIDADARYDLGLVDGPKDVADRPAVVAFALGRCDRVLVALETDSGTIMRDAVDRLSAAQRRPVEVIVSGPLAGAYALIGPRP